MTDALRRDLHFFPERDIPGEVFSDPLHGTGQKHRIAPGAIGQRVSSCVHRVVLAGTLPRAGVGSGAFGQNSGDNRLGRKVPVALNLDELTLGSFGQHNTIHCGFHALTVAVEAGSHPTRDNEVVRITARTTLDCSIDQAWEALHTPAVFREVSRPFTHFGEISGAPLPSRFENGGEYSVRVKAFGLVPLGHQIIRIRDTVTSFLVRSMTDAGEGVSGPLSLLREWNHEMELQAHPDGHTTLTDTLRARAGVLTPLVWPTFRFFWWWRHRQLRRIARTLESAQTRQWNSRYHSASSLWSGQVNYVVASVTETLRPGTCLDVGCGEGADALWLAARGWKVTGFDASSVALFRAATEQSRQQERDGQELAITWQVRDVVADGLSGPEVYDLVSIPFLHLEPSSREAVWRDALSRVAVGGTLLIIGHDRSDLETGLRRPPEHLLFGEEELKALVPSSWSSATVSRQPRTQTTSEGHTTTVNDIVLVAVR